MGINAPINRKFRMALVGGGAGSFIGRVHSIAACLDNRAVVTAGALSSDPERAKASAPDYDIDPSRAYGSYEAMLDAERRLPEDQRIDFVSIATPNHTHFEIARAAVEAGFNVICDKPMTFDLAQAESLLETVNGSDVVFAVSHNYTGYPLVRQARAMILGGELGEINAIRAQYIQGWLRTPLEDEEQKQATWRTDPSQKRRGRCVRRHCHTCLQPGALHDRHFSGCGQLQPEDFCRRSSAGRLRNRGDSLPERRAGNRDRVADQPRSRE